MFRTSGLVLAYLYSNIIRVEGMATSEELPIPASAFPVNNKLQRKVNVFKEVIESEKTEVRRIGREMRGAISRKEEEVIRELDAVWESVNAQIEKKKRDS